MGGFGTVMERTLRGHEVGRPGRGATVPSVRRPVRRHVRRHVRSFLGHRPSALGAYTAAGAVVVVSTFLPWLRSGSTSRSSYELLGLLDRLDIAPDGWISVLVRWWPLVPLLVVLAIVLAWWRRWVLSFATAFVGVLYTGGVGTALVVAAGRTPITVGPGPTVCALASVTFLVTAAWMAFSHASDRAVPAPVAAPPVDPS